MAESKANVSCPDEMWEFILYFSSGSKEGQKVESALKRLCDRYVPNRYRIKTIDIAKNIDDVPLDIIAVPTIIRLSPLPEKRVIGNLASEKLAVEGLGLDEL